MENLNEEQPIIKEENEQEVNCGVDELQASNLDNGSSIGKFKSTEALVNAYNNLQAEFTRRCQRIKNLEKQLSDASIDKDNKIDNYNDAENIVRGNDGNQSEEVQKSEKGMYDTADNELVPSYLKEDYDSELMSFLSVNKDAKNYAKEIGEEILKDKNLSLQSAYERVLAKKFKAPSELVQDKQFINDYILQNEEILKDIIKKYKSEENVLPTMIQNNSNTSIAQAYPVEVKTIKEAGELAKKLMS